MSSRSNEAFGDRNGKRKPQPDLQSLSDAELNEKIQRLLNDRQNETLIIRTTFSGDECRANRRPLN